MRTVNVRLAAICIVLVVVLGGGVHLLHGFQVRRQADALKVASEREEASAAAHKAAAESEADSLKIASEREEQAKDFKEAIRHLESYLVLQPKDHKAQYHLGMLYADQPNPIPASATLEDILRSDDSNFSPEELRKARRKVVEMAIMIGRLLDAQTHLEKLMKETPDDPELLQLDGQVLYFRHKDEEACAQLRKAIKIKPSQIDSYKLLAFILDQRLDKKDEADKVMQDMVNAKDDKGIAVNAKSLTALQAYADHLRRQAEADADPKRKQDKYKEALVQTNRILELAPEDSRGLLIAAQCYLAQAQYPAAEDSLNRGIKSKKADPVMYPAMYETMFDIKNRMGRRDEALAVLQQGIENTKGIGHALLLFDLVNAHIDLRKLNEAETGLKQLQGLGFDPALVEFLQARLAMVKGDWSSAKAILAAVVPKLQKNERFQKLAYHSLGQCYRQLADKGVGDAEQQIVADLEAVKIDPYFVPARESLAEAFIARGKLGDAAEQYRILLNSPHPDPAMELKLARIAIMMRLRQEKAKRDWGPVETMLDKIGQQQSLGLGVVTLKAEVLLAEGHPDQAETLLKQSTKTFPNSVTVWMALVKLAMVQAAQASDPADQQKKWQQASKYADQAEKVLGDNLIIRELRGNCAVLRKDPHVGAVLKELGDAKALDKWSESDRIQLWSILSNLSTQAGDLDLARFYSRLVAEKVPADIQSRRILCELDLQAYEKGQKPDLQELDKRLAEIKNLGGEGPYWQYGKAIRTFVQSQKPDPQMLMDARGYLKAALELRKDWAAPAVLAGKICELQKEPDQALEYYYRAVFVMGEHSNDVIRRTVHLLLPRRGYQDAKVLFDYLEQQKSSILGEMSQDYVNVKVFTGDIAEAERDLEKSVAGGSKNYEDYLRQGELYKVLAKRRANEALAKHRDWTTDPEMLRMLERAKDSLRHALELNTQADDVWVAIVQLYISVGQAEKAKPVIAEAETTLKGEQAPLTLAYFRELLGETEKAQSKYEEAAKAFPKNSHVLRRVATFYLNNRKPDLAEPLFRRIIELQSVETLNDACWARRSLANMLASRRDFVDLCQAIKLVDENLNSKASSTDDLRAKVQFLMADPRKEKIGEAIQAMEDLVKDTHATPDDYYGLALLYLRKGDWTAYHDRMQSVLGAQKGAFEPNYVMNYVANLLAKKEFEEANNWLNTLEKKDEEKEKNLSKQDRAALPHNNFETARLRAEYHFVHGDNAAASDAAPDYAAASDTAMGFLGNPDAYPQDRGQQLLRVAALMENFSDRLKAEDKLVVAKDFAQKADECFASLRRVSSLGDIYFAAHLGRQGRTRECLQVLEQCWDKYPAGSLQLPAVAILQSKAADTPQYQRLEEILIAAANKANRPVSLLMVLAVLHAQMRQDDKSIADYREILVKEPRNYRAMNNLGLALARTGQNLDEALKLLDEALIIRGPMAEVLDSRAVIYIARQEPQKALHDLDNAIKDDGAAEQYFHRAWAYSLAGKKSDAALAFATARNKRLDSKSLDPHEVSVYDRLNSEL